MTLRAGSPPSARGRDDVQLAGERAVHAGVDEPLAVRRPVVVEDLHVVDDDLLRRCRRGSWSRACRRGGRRSRLPSGEKLTPISASGVSVSCLTLKLVGLDQLGMLGVVGLQQVEVLVAVAVGDEEDLLAVGRPGDAVVVGRVIGQPRGLAAVRSACRNSSPWTTKATCFSSGDRANSVAPLVKVVDPLGVGLVVGVDLDGQLARACRPCVRDDPQVGAALVDDPLAVAADAGPADAVVLVVGDLRAACRRLLAERRWRTMLAGVPQYSLT